MVLSPLFSDAYPDVIGEFLPRPSQAYLETLQAAIEQANQEGWLEGDPETGLPNGLTIRDILPLVAAVDETEL